MPLILNGTTGVSGVDGTAGTPAVRGGDANTGFVFGTDIIQVIEGGAESARFDASGNLLVGVTSANANGGVLQLKSGITFPATQVTSTDVNTLDDYEEGTWTPTDASGASLTFTTATGFYTKIGNRVIASFRADYPSTANGSQASIGGLPFAVTSTGSDGANSGTFIRYTTYSSAFTLPPANNGTTMPAFSYGAGVITNANLSTRRIDAVVVYQTNT